MKRFIVLGALALCLLSGTAMADKARNIAFRMRIHNTTRHIWKTIWIRRMCTARATM